jgi:hypothetical protein
MAKKSKKHEKKSVKTSLKPEMLKTIERRCRLLGTDDLKIVLQDATMRVSREVRIDELEEAELYANIVMTAVNELRRRE